MAAPFPTTPEEIDPGWLSQALGVPVRSHQVTPIADRQGVNGETHRVLLESADGPSSLVAKFPHAPSRGVAQYQRWYEREVRFYRELAASTPIRTPRCFVAEIAPNDDFVLLLEDLRPLRQGDQVRGCTAKEALPVVRSLARMHARWWDVAPVAHEWLPYTTVGLERGGPVSGAFARAWSRVRDLVDPGAHAVLDAGVEQYVALLEEISAPPVTLTHGDFRLDNMFFEDAPDGGDGDDGAEAPDGPVVFDWQFTCRTRGAYDLAYFLALDLDPAELADHEDTLIEAYRDTIEALSVDYPADALRRDYAVSLVLSTAVFAIGAGGPQPSEASRVMHEIGLRRLGSAIARLAGQGWPVAPQAV